MIAAVFAAALLAAADPCAAVEQAPVPDIAAAAAYRQVGDGERAAGEHDTAVVAYRSALALDPSDAASRAALVRLCREGAAANDPFPLGLARMDEGDPKGAIAAFRRARLAGPDPSAALLEGICHYEIGEETEAVALLREAEAAPAHRDAASFYLGLIALRRGDGQRASAFLDVAAGTPAFGLLAADLARLARRDARLAVSFLAETGWDSNATLAQTGTPLGTSSDASAALTATALYRPDGENGPYFRGAGVYSQQARVTALDLGGLSGAAGWQLGRARQALLVEYDYDFRTLGGSPFLSAHRLLVSGWFTAGDVTLGATYFARFESYQPSIYTPFDGTWQRAEARASLGLGPTLRLGVAYRVGGDAVRQSYLSWLEHGPRVDLRWEPTRRLRLGVEAAVGLRAYQSVDPGFGRQRSDTYLDGAALAELDVGDRWTLRLSVAARRALSNEAAFDYAKIVPTFGMAYVFGL